MRQIICPTCQRSIRVYWVNGVDVLELLPPTDPGYHEALARCTTCETSYLVGVTIELTVLQKPAKDI